MNCGCSTTIPRQNGKLRNGTWKVLLVRRKHAWADPGWKQWLLFFSTAVALCTKNLYLEDRQLITPSTKMSWNDFENGSSESERTLQTTGCCTTITRRLTPYSPDLAPCDFYLFPKLKLKLKGHHFRTIVNIQKVVTDELNTLTENDSRYCYDQWKKRWNHCVTSQGVWRRSLVISGESNRHLNKKSVHLLLRQTSYILTGPCTAMFTEKTNIHNTM